MPNAYNPQGRKRPKYDPPDKYFTFCEKISIQALDITLIFLHIQDKDSPIGDLTIPRVVDLSMPDIIRIWGNLSTRAPSRKY